MMTLTKMSNAVRPVCFSAGRFCFILPDMARHILLVDDDALMRRSLAFNLEQAGFRASTAANAEDALSLAKQTPPDLVLLDIGLPDMDGLEMLRLFRSSRCTAVSVS